MGPLTTELIGVLSELAELLDSDGERHWRSVILTVRSGLEASDHSAIERLLGTYGGMGSFNDLVLGQTSKDGEFAWKPGHKEANERLNALRSRAWQLAQAIRRSYT